MHRAHIRHNRDGACDNFELQKELIIDIIEMVANHVDETWTAAMISFASSSNIVFNYDDHMGLENVISAGKN